MSDAQPDDPSTVFNVPNQVTAVRLLLAVVLFIMIGVAQAVTASRPVLAGQLYFAAMVVFLIAAGTDWLDGYWARKFGQVTTVGRIFDPFADKVIMCGTFIFLVPVSERSGVFAWMAVIIVARELLVTALRSFVEQRGGDFSANLLGKLKMVLQCAAAAVSLWVLSWSGTPPPWLVWTGLLLIWAAVLVTIYSGATYVVAAAKVLRN